MHRCFHNQRGSALVITLLITTVIAVILTGLFQRVLGQRIGADAEVGVSAVVRATNDYATVTRIQLWDHASNPDGSPLPSTPSYTPAIGAPWHADPSTPFAWGVPDEASFATSPVYSSDIFTDPRSLLRYSPYTRAIRYHPSLGIQTTLSETTIRRLVEVDISFYETPTLGFEFVTTDQPFDVQGSSRIMVEGTALLAMGSTGTNTHDSTVSGGVLVPGTAASTLERIATSPRERATWGIDTGDLLSMSISTVAGRAQSYAQVPGAVVISYPLAGNVPTGSDFYSLDFDGQSYLAINLETYAGPSHIFVDASATGASVGVMLFGASDGEALSPVVVAGTCRFTLVGSNKRPMSLISNHPVLTLYSHANSGLPDPAATAIDTGWRGYIHLPVINPQIRTPQPWSGATYTLFGSLAFKGGTLSINSGVPVLDAFRIVRSVILKTALQPPTVHKDRILFSSSR